MLTENTNTSGIPYMSVFPILTNTHIDLQQTNKRESLKRPFPFSNDLENCEINPPKKQRKFSSSHSVKYDINQTKQSHIRSQACMGKINMVPEHILCYILSFFTQKELITSITLISSKWHNLSRAPSLWQQIDFKQFGIKSLPQISSFLENTFSNCLHSFKGNIFLPPSCESLTSQSFQKLRRVCPDLRGITLPELKQGNLGITNNTLKYISTFSNLEEFCAATHSRITDEGINELTSNCRNLKKINLNNCKNITSESFDYLLDRCSSLQSISILGKRINCVLEDDQIYSLSKKGFKIENLRAKFGYVSHQAIQYLVEHGSALKNLVISGWKSLNPQLLETLITGLPHLEQLVIMGENDVDLKNANIKSSSLQRITFSSIKYATQLKIQCPRLKRLKFEECDEVSLFEDSANLASLKQLGFRSCSFIQLDIQRITRSAPILEAFELVNCGMMPRSAIQIDSSTLKYVTLFFCRNLIDVKLNCPHLNTLHIDILKDIWSLEINCLELKQLQLFRVPYIEYPNFKRLNLNSNLIQSLNLQRCITLEKAVIRGNSLDALNMAGCRYLRTLELDCPKLDKLALGSQFLEFNNDFIQHIIHNCPQVSMFSVLSPKLTDEAISELCTRWNNLQALVLSNCNKLIHPVINSFKLKGIQVTDCEILQDINLKTPSLSKVFLRNCNHMNDNSIESILDTCSLVKFCEIHNCPVVSPSLSNRSLIEIQFNNCNQLKQPNINCPSIQKLVFGNCATLTSIRSVQDLCSLSELLFFHCPMMTDESLKTMNMRSTNIVLANCDGLQTPTIHTASQQKIQFLQCKNLIKPTLYGDQSVNNLVFSNCPKLNFESTHELSDSTIDTLVFDKCNRLDHLEINSAICNVQLYDVSVTNFYVKNNETQKLQIKKCQELHQIGITSSSLYALAIEGCPHLTTITPSHSLNLKLLSLYECTRINDTVIMALFNAAPLLCSALLCKIGITTPVFIHNSLESLKIYRSKMLSRLFVACSNLKSLHVSGSPKISNRDVVLCVDGKPRYCPESSLSYREDGICVSLVK